MKKSLIVLAIAGAFAAPAAFAEVMIYGDANVSINSVNTGSDHGVSSATATQIASNASKIGVKGTEDMGGGTSAIWQIETYVAMQNSNANTFSSYPNSNYGGGNGNVNQLGTADTFAGLAGSSWGKLQLGQLDLPYKASTRGLDMFADTIADNRSLMGPLDGTEQAHMPNTIAYTTPSMSGVSLAIAYVAGADVPVPGGGNKGSATSLSAMYSGGPFTADFAYQTLTVGSCTGGCNGSLSTLVGNGLNVGGGISGFPALAANDRLTAWKLAGSYSLDAFAVNAIVERATFDQNGGTSNSGTKWYIAGKYNVTSNDALKLAYTHVNDISGGNNGAKQTAVGYDHSMSKHTSLYALYTKVTDDTNHSTTLGGFDGITGNVVGGGAKGASPYAWSLGMRHAF